MRKCIPFILLALFITNFNKAYSQNGEVDSASVSNKKFNAGDLIIDHVTDSHEWHILSLGNFQLTLPLPIILVCEKKLYIFSSSKFQGGKVTYKGFKIITEGKNKGAIVKVNNATSSSNAMVVDLSITRVVMGVFVSCIALIIIALYIAKQYKNNEKTPPKGLQSAIEPLIVFVRDDIAKPSIGDGYAKYMPFILTLFFFILLTNLLGLIPIFPFGGNITGNISVTLTLAMFTFLTIIFSGNKHFWKHIFNSPEAPWWLKFPIPLMQIIEFMGFIVKPIVLMVRLFANITAGHIITLGFISLIFIFATFNAMAGYGISLLSLIMSLFIALLELLVSFIQAYVFTILSAIYIGMATEKIIEKKEFK